MNTEIKIFIYLENSNNKIEYIFDHLIQNILGFKIIFTFNEQEFKQIKEPKISYCSKNISDELHFKSSDFFNENNLIKLEERIKNPDFLIDKIAVSFALLTRLEEYFKHKKDDFGRFNYSESFLFTKINVKEPFIDNFAYGILEKLRINSPNLKVSKKFIEQSTLDLDHPFLIKYKTPKRTLFSLFSPLKKANFNDFFTKIFILLGLKKDPFDIYEKANLTQNLIYFLPLGKFSKIDSFHQTENKKYVNFLKELNKIKKLNFHPSYFSSLNDTILEKEIQEFKHIFGEIPESSRQHFIALNIPKTYKNLIKQQIFNDYSMGFVDQIGFRAATCTPFFWFDLENNKITDLKIFPFCWMDVTFTKYLKLSQSEIIQEIKKLKLNVQKVKGFYSYIIHNETFFQFKI